MEFRINLNVSRKSYPTKPADSSSLTFESQNVTIDELETLVREGHAFCYNFKIRAPVITNHDRRCDNFDFTNVVCYDMDKMGVPMKAYIEGLKYRPTLAYTTYSNGSGGKYGYRLLYIFETPISSEEEYYQYCLAIAESNDITGGTNSNGELTGWDQRRVNQLYYGGGPDSETYKSGIIYSLFTFASHCDKEKAAAMFTESHRSYTPDITIDEDFLQSYRTLAPKDFIEKYEHGFLLAYMESVQPKSGLIYSEDGQYYTYPDDYVCVMRN